jgi:O-acetylserine/cysteine efflux transporter
MNAKHIVLAILTAAIWGCNFIFISTALSDLPPYLLCALRFFFSCFPVIFFLPKPKAGFKLVLGYGLFMFGVQFALLFAGMDAGMPPGLTSLVFQSQVFFSLFFAAIFLQERPSPLQLLGALISFAGLGVVWVNYTDSATWVGFVLIIGAAIAMGFGNLFSRKLAQENSYSLVAWGSFYSLFLLIPLSLYMDGPGLILHSLVNVSWMSVGSLAFTVYISTWVGYGAWNKLLRGYSIAAVIPFTLLVPVFGVLSSHIFLGEPVQQWKLLSAWLIICGLGINVLGSRLRLKRQKALEAAVAEAS